MAFCGNDVCRVLFKGSESEMENQDFEFLIRFTG